MWILTKQPPAWVSQGPASFPSEESTAPPPSPYSSSLYLVSSIAYEYRMTTQHVVQPNWEYEIRGCFCKFSHHEFFWEEEQQTSILWVISKSPLGVLRRLQGELFYLNTIGQGGFNVVADLLVSGQTCRGAGVLHYTQLLSTGPRGVYRFCLKATFDIGVPERACTSNSGHNQIDAWRQWQWITWGVFPVSTPVYLFTGTVVSVGRVNSLILLIWMRQFQDPGLNFPFLTCCLQTVHHKISNNTWLK